MRIKKIYKCFPKECSRCSKKYKPTSPSNKLCLSCRSKVNHRFKKNKEQYISKIFIKKTKGSEDLKKYYKNIITCKGCHRIFGSDGKFEYSVCPICIQAGCNRKSLFKKKEERNAFSK